MSVLGLVPARAGSKGLPGKNVRLLHGQPLLAWTAAAARASGVIDRLVLSTDAEEIAAIGRAAGMETPFLRPPVLAGDETPMLPVIEHAVDALEADGWLPDIIVLLQPTSPLRTGAHVRRSVALLRESGADSVVSVVELPRHHSPDYVMRVDGGRLVPFLPDGLRIGRRQDARPAYVRDGTVYTFWRSTLQVKGNLYGDDCRPLVVPAAESLTIDSADDWAEAERRLGAATGD
ncbi:MAG: acylneuraminate cytidylyltransferase family protein [Acidimicrobiia bacterium]|nr:acylneuraminate cytidylyltransferase family protein [Acidimicrobiia bacterium]